MRKVLGLALVIGALALTPLAVSADLTNGNGQSCEGIGVWHFVNNQTGGAAAGSLTAQFSGGVTITTGPSKVLSNTQHFFVETTAGATLVDETTNLPGRLQLSDFSCDSGKKGGGK